MRNSTIRWAAAGLVAVIGASVLSSAMAAGPPERMLAHDVYFTLKDRSEEASAKLVAGCQKYLSDHPGTVWFAAGPIVAEHEREVNDRGFDVALHIVFKNKAAHDKYQDAPKHHEFIEECGDLWESVRVFDSWLDVSGHGELTVDRRRPDRVKMPRLPDPAALFAGMIQGKVAAKLDGQIVVDVEKVTRVWKTNKAKNPESLLGQKVLVRASKEGGRYAKRVAQFLDGLKVGESVTLDVAHKDKGEALTILELTEEQRKRLEQP